MNKYPYKYFYLVNSEENRDIFFKTCKEIEHNISGIKKEKLLHDVDDSLIQPYTFGLEKFVVKDDVDEDCVEIKSTISLKKFVSYKEIAV